MGNSSEQGYVNFFFDGSYIKKKCKNKKKLVKSQLYEFVINLHPNLQASSIMSRLS